MDLDEDVPVGHRDARRDLVMSAVYVGDHDASPRSKESAKLTKRGVNVFDVREDEAARQQIENWRLERDGRTTTVLRWACNRRVSSNGCVESAVRSHDASRSV